MKHTVVTLPQITFNYTFKNKKAARQAAIIAFINMLHHQVNLLKDIIKRLDFKGFKFTDLGTLKPKIKLSVTYQEHPAHPDIEIGIFGDENL